MFLKNKQHTYWMILDIIPFVRLTAAIIVESIKICAIDYTDETIVDINNNYNAKLMTIIIMQFYNV